MLKNELIGTWFLQEWDCTLDSHYHNHPFGERATGTLCYTPGGRMTAILMKAERSNLSTPSLLQATAEERALAAEGYVSYGGSWRVEGDRVIHSVDFSLLPSWIGTELQRTISWTRDHSAAADEPAQLILSTAPQRTTSGKIVVNRLRWKLK